MGERTAPTEPIDPAERAPVTGMGVVGRYHLLREIGRGAMGQVFAGFDPDLGRAVAVKLVADRSHALAPYLLREARMLAATSHPNLVAVYDVGQDAGQLFIVMELVDGSSLARWLDTPRAPREITRAWCAAGRGLAAAHAAGVVHRDFKASNVLISTAGDVRVADFGLARDVGDATPAVEGTAGYMAPELVAHGTATEASDQFAYCVSLKRALGDAIPRRIRSAIERGLATEPAARWPSMTALVDALERGSRRRTVALAGGAAIVAVAVAVVSWSLLGGSGAATCEASDDVVERELPSATRERLSAALRAGGLPHAAAMAATTDRLLADSIAAWSSAHAEACASPSRRTCIEARLDELASVVDDALVDRGDALYEVPIQVARWRGELTSCASSARILPEPDRAYRHALARALAQSQLGRTAAAIASADIAIALARDPRSLIRAKVRRVIVDDRPSSDLDALYREAQAQTTVDPALPGNVALAAAGACFPQETTDCAAAWIDKLAASLASLPTTDEPILRAYLAGLRGEVAIRAGDPTIAAAMFQDESRRLSAALGNDGFELHAAQSSLAGAYLDLRRYPESLDAAKHADAIVVRWLGEDHPYRVKELSQLGASQLRAGDAAAGIASLEHAIALTIEFKGDGSSELANLYNNLAAAYLNLGQPAHALALVDRSIAAYARRPGRDGGRLLPTMRNGAMLASVLAHPDARARVDAAIKLAHDWLTPDHPEWASLFQQRGLIELRAGDAAGAAADFARALAGYEHGGERARGDQAVSHAYLALLAIRNHQLDVAQRELAAVEQLAPAIPGGTVRRMWLDIVAAELAIARGDDARARDKLAAVGAQLVGDAARANPRVRAYYDIVAATLATRARDPAAAAAARTHAFEALRAADIPDDAVYADCVTCR